MHQCLPSMAILPGWSQDLETISPKFLTSKKTLNNTTVLFCQLIQISYYQRSIERMARRFQRPTTGDCSCPGLPAPIKVSPFQPYANCIQDFCHNRCVSFLDRNGKDRKYGGGQGPRVVASFNTKQLAAWEQDLIFFNPIISQSPPTLQSSKVIPVLSNFSNFSLRSPPLCATPLFLNAESVKTSQSLYICYSSRKGKKKSPRQRTPQISCSNSKKDGVRLRRSSNVYCQRTPN